MIRYKKYQNKNEKSPSSYMKYYARAIHDRVTFEEFITHMANHHCVFSEGTIRGVLVEMENCLRELLLEGKAVEFDELGIFKIGIATRGADSASDFSVNNIHSVHLNLFLGKRFRARQLFNDATFKETDIYAGFDGDDGESATTEP